MILNPKGMAVICNSNVNSLSFCSHSNFDRPKGNQTFTWSLESSKTQVWYCTAKLKLSLSAWSGIFLPGSLTVTSLQAVFSLTQGDCTILAISPSEFLTDTLRQENRKPGKERLPSMATWAFHECFALLASWLDVLLMIVEFI